LMLTLCLSLAAYLRLIQKTVPLITVLNLLGPTFFLPFVVVQPVDQVIIAAWGWALVPASIAHTSCFCGKVGLQWRSSPA
jgi:hypothetical protein